MVLKEVVEPLNLEKPAEEDIPDTRTDIDWLNVLIIIHIHLISLYGIFFHLSYTQYGTIFLTLLLGTVSFLGVSAGAHRLWTHRSYQAEWPLKVFLAICFTIVGDGTLYHWILNHRLHHKYRGTNADPYNHRKGFLYSHLTSRMFKHSPEMERLKRGIDMSDIKSDSVVMFQKHYSWVTMPLISLIIPLDLPMELFGESFSNAFFITILRYTIVLHMSWLVNSAFLIWALKPDDKYPTLTYWIYVMTPTYWPQYHYLLPWDSQTDEFGSYGESCTSKFIKIAEVMKQASQLLTTEGTQVLNALYSHVDTKRPVKQCFKELQEAEEKRAQLAHYKVLNLQKLW